MTDPLSIEKVFGNFVVEVGGELVDDLIAGPCAPKHADYFFRKESVVAELKSLEKETFDKGYQVKINALAREWVDRGLIEKPSSRYQTLNLQDLPTECQREWTRLLIGPLQQHVLKQANKFEKLRGPSAYPTRKVSSS